MGELAPPDLMDSGGRLRRLALALLLGAAAATATYLICDSMAKPDELAGEGVYTSGHVERAYKFVYYFTALAGGLVFSITLAIANRLEKKRYRESLVARAQQVRSK